MRSFCGIDPFANFGEMSGRCDANVHCDRCRFLPGFYGEDRAIELGGWTLIQCFPFYDQSYDLLYSECPHLVLGAKGGRIY